MCRTLLLLASCLTLTPALAAPEPPAARAGECRLAVLPFREGSSATGALGARLADATVRNLSIALRGRPVQVLGRADLGGVAARLQEAGSMPSDPGALLRVARSAGLNYLLIGSITGRRATLIDPHAALRHPPVRREGSELDRAVVLVRTLDSAAGGRELLTQVAVEARLLPTQSAAGPGAFQVEGSSSGPAADYSGAAANAAVRLATRVRSSLPRDAGAGLTRSASSAQPALRPPGRTPDGQILQTQRPVDSQPSQRRRDGWVLEADSLDSVAVKLGRDHGVEPRSRWLMRWKEPVRGDSTVRRTVESYRIEVVETDTAGVILKVLGADRTKKLPPVSEMVVLEPLRT